MGGRGAESGGRYGGGGGVGDDAILDTTSLVSEREREKAAVDETLAVFSDFYDEYGFVASDIQLALLKPGVNAMAYYDSNGNIAFNKAYFNQAKIAAAYERCVKDGFHPSSGNKTAMQAVMAHEIGHGLTQSVAEKMSQYGAPGLDAAATRIVTEARKSTGHRGVVKMASKISTYATSSNAEAVAEAVCDVYCNGKGAKRESHAIVKVINKYLKGA